MSEDRETLADFLRTRRAKVSPADVGLPPGLRRRTPGLRRDEVAVLAGISVTWYRYLEQGRSVQPSDQVLDALARVLLLSEDERRYLHLLASRTPDRQRPLTAEISGADIIRQLVVLNEDNPYPVYAADISCDLLAWNPSADRYYDGFGATASAAPNMLRWLLFDDEARRRLPQWSADACDVVHRWRPLVAAHGDDPRVRARMEEFRNSGEFREWWDQHDVQLHRSRTRFFELPGRPTEALRLVVVQAPEFVPSFVVFHVPTDPTRKEQHHDTRRMVGDVAAGQL